MLLGFPRYEWPEHRGATYPKEAGKDAACEFNCLKPSILCGLHPAQMSGTSQATNVPRTTWVLESRKDPGGLRVVSMKVGPSDPNGVYLASGLLVSKLPRTDTSRKFAIFGMSWNFEGRQSSICSRRSFISPAKFKGSIFRSWTNLPSFVQAEANGI